MASMSPFSTFVGISQARDLRWRVFLRYSRMNIHVVWAQGWDKAPARAIRNAQAWEAVGTVYRWCEKTAERELGLLPEICSFCKFPAMKADVILAAAMVKMGGLAVGADMEPLDVAAIQLSVGEAEKLGVGLVVYQSLRDEPYSGASYFPAGHPWIVMVHEKQKQAVVEGGSNRNVSAVTGPRMWRLLMRANPGLWFSSVRTVPAWLAFSFEPKTRGTFRPAWINPGLTGDWAGENGARWR
jgi:hypothetical protein